MKKMFEIIVSDKTGHCTEALSYILSQETRLCGGVFAEYKDEHRYNISMAVNDKFRPYFTERVREEVANYIAVEHKYDYFLNQLTFLPLTNLQKIGFCSALAVFDKATDIRYTKERLLFDSQINIDSATMFCMPELFERWKEISELISSNGLELSGETGIMEMMRFLLKQSPNENGTIHLISTDGKLAISNDQNKVIFSYNKENKDKLLHRAISLLPKHLAVHGADFDYINDLFLQKNQISLTK